jgi:hypothetical protein
MIRPVSSMDNLHTVASTGYPLGAACARCQHRATLDPSMVYAPLGNTTRLIDLQTWCGECKSKSYSFFLFHLKQEVDDFLAGKPEW